MAVGCWSLFVDRGDGGRSCVVVGAGRRWLMVVVGAGRRLLVVLMGVHLCLLLVLARAHGSWSPFLGVGGGWPWFDGGRFAEDGGSGSFVVVGVLVACVRLGAGVLVHRCHCPVVCHVGGNDVAPGKRAVRARGLLNPRWGCLLTCGQKRQTVTMWYIITVRRRVVASP